jgi:hypothetical protein
MHFVGEQDDDFVSIEPGEDKIILMRADEAFGGVGFGCSFSAKPKGRSTREKVQAVKELEFNPLTDEISYAFEQTDDGATVVFNNESDKAFKVTLDIDGSENVRIEDGDTFLEKTVLVHPQKRVAIMLKVLSRYGSTSISMNFRFEDAET